MCILLLVLINVKIAICAEADLSEKDFILPMPGNKNMVFKPVFLGEGNTEFSIKKFKVGDPDGGFKEYPTTVALGGSFIGEKNGHSDWMYYIGKYEVTKAQYFSIMEREGTVNNADTQMPIADISWFDALTFVNKYNQWLFLNAVDKLPKNENSVGFVRLPTEIEWEFAARGGSDVSEDVFDQKYPYKEKIEFFEWFSGPTSSHNRVREVGLLKPNQLGLYDMLGNVSEMTASFYQIEYYQGRYGGFVSRGGHYLSSEKRLRSSLRTEEPFYSKLKSEKIKENKKPTMGFRIVISSNIFVSRDSGKKLSDAWEEYRNSKGSSLPAAISVSSTSTKTNVKTDDIFNYLNRLRNKLKSNGIESEAVARELKLLESSLADIKFIQTKAEEDSSYAWAKIASERGFFIFKEAQKIPTIKKLIEIAKKTNRTSILEKYEERYTELEKNIEQALSTYSDSLRQLSKINPDIVSGGFKKYSDFLAKHDVKEQIKINKIVQNHAISFQKNQRVDLEKWKKDFLNN